MKKDYFWLTIIGLLVLSYVLDRIGGIVSLNLKNPYQFLASPNLNTYPLTAVSIAAKAISLVGTLVLAFSYLKISPFIKAIVLFLVAALGQLYSIQQLATKGVVTPITWTIGIAFAGALSLLPILIYVLKGLFTSAQHALVKELQPVRHDLKSYPGPSES